MPKAQDMNRKTFTALLLSFAVLSACASEQGKTGENIGTAVGAVIGSVVGAKAGSGSGKSLGTGLGAIFGAWLGQVMGKKLDEQDQQKVNEKAQETMETTEVGQTTTWTNPDTGNSGTMTPTTARNTEDGKDCRDFETSVMIDGKKEKASGRACRQEDGAWKIIE